MKILNVKIRISLLDRHWDSSKEGKKETNLSRSSLFFLNLTNIVFCEEIIKIERRICMFHSKYRYQDL